MCGICGIYNFDNQKPVDHSLLKRMNDLLQHRGPDEEGYFVRNNIGFGHKRLSIIDLSEGQQPMQVSHSGKELVITYNGEIYNYIELRDELKKLGFSFKSNSDTEIILKAYLAWGEECVNHFNGMWAFGLWDQNENKLFLSRDRMGEKPLYYYIDDNQFLFASELTSILENNISIDPNLDLLYLYLLLKYIPAPHTMIKNVHILEPGHNLIMEGRKSTNYSYWDLPEIDKGDLITDKKRVYEEFDYLFHDSVRLRMRSDVPFGAFLSGGLDSSSIVSVMSEYSSHQLNTFSIGFNEKEFDERDLAKLVAEKYGTSHHVSVVEQDSYYESLEKVNRHYGDPFGDSSAIPTGVVSRFAAGNVKMVLTGDGGDEVLSGYTTYQGEKIASYYKRLPGLLRTAIPSTIASMSNGFSGSIKYKMNRISGALSSSNLTFVDRLAYKAGHIDPKVLSDLICDEEKYMSFHDFYNEKFSFLSEDLDSFYKLMYWNLKVSLPDDMLTKVDRMSMANSLETRIPFLDHRLVEFLVMVDKNIKMEGFERKSVLRNTIAKTLPAPLLKSGKKGFRVPLREWFKNEELLSTLYDLNGLGNLIDPIKWRDLLEANKSGKTDAGNFIWSVAVLKKWFDIYS